MRDKEDILSCEKESGHLLPPLSHLPHARTHTHTHTHTRMSLQQLPVEFLKFPAVVGYPGMQVLKRQS